MAFNLLLMGLSLWLEVAICVPSQFTLVSLQMLMEGVNTY